MGIHSGPSAEVQPSLFDGSHEREGEQLISILLEFSACHDAQLSKSIGRFSHAMFHDLLKQINPALSAHVHSTPDYRPFTISLPEPLRAHNETFVIQRGQQLSMRVTLLDGGTIWRELQTHFLEAGAIEVRLGTALLRLNRMLSTQKREPNEQVLITSWENLLSLPTSQTITFQFVSPTAFSRGKHLFELFPKPYLVWDSLARDWNKYAPTRLSIDRRYIQMYAQQYVIVQDINLSTTTVTMFNYQQKGFIGTCTYAIPDQQTATNLTVLARFAFFAGVGSKTTMGMGQTRTICTSSGALSNAQVKCLDSNEEDF